MEVIITITQELIKGITREGFVYYVNEIGEVVSRECSKCSDIKDIKHFSKKPGGKFGRRAYCKTCRSDYYKANKEKAIKLALEWYYKHKDIDDRMIKPNKSYVGQGGGRLRSERLKALPNTLTVDELEEIMNKFNGCALTGDSSNIHMDHVIPIATEKGGTVKENIIPLRADLNMSKGSKNIFEWFEENADKYSLSRKSFEELINYLADINGMSVEEYRAYVYECHEH